jgi:hypothetical protein
VGRNVWYFAGNAIFRTRRGLIEEIGIAERSLITTRKAKSAFLRSFS